MKNLTELTGVEVKMQIDVVRYELHTGKLNYDEAKEKAQPYINEMNRRGLIIAKKHKRRFKGFQFAALMR